MSVLLLKLNRQCSKESRDTTLSTKFSLTGIYESTFKGLILKLQTPEVA